MSLEENKAIIRRWIDEVLHKGNLAMVDKMVDSRYALHIPGYDVSGPVELKKVLIEFRNAFPDLNVTIEDLIAVGDKVVLRYKCKATHRGELMGLAATGRQVTWTGTIISLLEGGKMVEDWEEWDALGLMQQLGAVNLPK